MDLLGTRQVDPIHQSPQTRAYGFFAKGTVPSSLIFTHLVSFLFLPISPPLLPLPPLLAHPYSSGFLSLPVHLRRLPSPTHSGRRSLGHAAFAALQVLFSRRTTDRASLAISLALIGPLTPMPTGDSVSSPEVTHCSSVPCRPQTPWCGG